MVLHANLPSVKQDFNIYCIIVESVYLKLFWLLTVLFCNNCIFSKSQNNYYEQYKKQSILCSSLIPNIMACTWKGGKSQLPLHWYKVSDDKKQLEKKPTNSRKNDNKKT